MSPPPHLCGGGLTVLAAHTEQALDAARYWLDVVLIGGLANP
ncbi:hypothetical protein [Deinococcus sp. UYEF24]